MDAKFLELQIAIAKIAEGLEHAEVADMLRTIAMSYEAE